MNPALTAALWIAAGLAAFPQEFPGSRYVRSVGMGEQAVALPSAVEALAYNPANLAFALRPVIAWSNNVRDFPAAATWTENAVGLAATIPGAVAVGLSFNSARNAFPFTSVGFRQSAAVGFAAPVGEGFSAGAGVRYFHGSEPGGFSERAWSVSAGVVYDRAYAAGRLTAGLALADFGDGIRMQTDLVSADSLQPWKGSVNRYSFMAPAPAKINAGVSWSANAGPAGVPVQIAVSRTMKKTRMDGGIANVENSLRALFDAWDGFPADAVVHAGAGLEWKPLGLGGNWSIFENMYWGARFAGGKSGLPNLLTQAVEVGLTSSAFSFSIGCSGAWHTAGYYDPRYGVLFTSGLPDGNVSVQLQLNPALFNVPQFPKDEAVRPRKIILSAGLFGRRRVGRYTSELANAEFVKVGVSRVYGYLTADSRVRNYNSTVVQFEAACYFDERRAAVFSVWFDGMRTRGAASALVSAPAPGPGSGSEEEYRSSITGLAAGFRYHPFSAAPPAYVQLMAGVVCSNPESYSVPRYSFMPQLAVTAGAAFPAFGKFLIQAETGYDAYFYHVSNAKRQAGAFGSLLFGIKIGFIL